MALNTYLIENVMHLPAAAAVGNSEWRQQVTMIAVAARKKDLAQLLGDVGAGSFIAGDARLNNDFTPRNEFVTDGVISLDRPGVYAVGQGRIDVLVEMTAKSEPAVIARRGWVPVP